MTLRKVLLFIGAGLLGAAVVALPVAAGSEGAPLIEALNHSGAKPEHEWSPNKATVAAGGSVTISNSSTVEHGVEWVSEPKGAVPACSGVDGTSGQPRSGIKWQGSCTFSQPGTYVFYCTVHGPEMTGTVTVTATGTTTTTSTGTSPGTPPPAPGTPSSGSQGGAGPAAPSGNASPLAGDAVSAVKVAGAQRGRVVRGSVTVSQAGAGGRLEVDLLATRATLARSSAASTVRVGRVVRSMLLAGKVSFSVALSSRARAALAHRGRLSLEVRVVLTPASGSATTIVRGVRLRG